MQASAEQNGNDEEKRWIATAAQQFSSWNISQKKKHPLTCVVVVGDLLFFHFPLFHKEDKSVPAHRFLCYSCISSSFFLFRHNSALYHRELRSCGIQPMIIRSILCPARHFFPPFSPKGSVVQKSRAKQSDQDLANEGQRIISCALAFANRRKNTNFNYIYRVYTTISLSQNNSLPFVVPSIRCTLRVRRRYRDTQQQIKMLSQSCMLTEHVCCWIFQLSLCVTTNVIRLEIVQSMVQFNHITSISHANVTWSTTNKAVQ